MQVMKETPGQSALTIDESASVLPEHRFGRIVETISERCGQAVANEEMISQKVTDSIGRSIGV